MENLLKISFMCGLIFMAPIIILSLFLIWCEDGYPMIFVQKRLGKSKKQFNLYKIRTMYKSAPNLGTHQVNKNYELRFGSFLRKFKIDELPQLINYLKGDILLVGPRPGLPNQKELKNYREKYNVFDVRPGITGLAQVLGYDMSNPKLLALIDNLYIKQKTIKLDAIIFFATFFKPFRNKLREEFGYSINQFKDEMNHV